MSARPSARPSWRPSAVDPEWSRGRDRHDLSARRAADQRARGALCRPPLRVDILSFVGGGERRPEEQPNAPADAPSASAYVSSLRLAAGLSIGDVAERAAVTPEWLERFEAGELEQGIGYAELLTLVRATEPPRPEWWDEGHEHDLHMSAVSPVDRDRGPSYWARIDQVRDANRRARSANDRG